MSLNHVDAVHLLEKGPLFERSRLFELGAAFDCSSADLSSIAIRRVLGRSNAGWWECELPANNLTWTTGVYDIFGLPRAARVSRAEAVGFYCEDSRAVMERLRGHAIDHRTGFLVDAKIRPASGEGDRWMRLIGAPRVEDGRTVGLYGLKLII